MGKNKKNMTEEIIINENVVEEMTTFEKGKELGHKYRKKILGGLCVVGATTAGFIGGVLFKGHQLEEDDPIGDFIEEVESEEI